MFKRVGTLIEVHLRSRSKQKFDQNKSLTYTRKFGSVKAEVLGISAEIYVDNQAKRANCMAF